MITDRDLLVRQLREDEAGMLRVLPHGAEFGPDTCRALAEHFAAAAHMLSESAESGAQVSVVPVPDGELVEKVKLIALDEAWKAPDEGIRWDRMTARLSALLSQPAAQQDALRVAAAEYRAATVAVADGLCDAPGDTTPFDRLDAARDALMRAALAATPGRDQVGPQGIAAALRTAAMKWWEGKRPIRWTRQEHIDCPLVNTTTDREQELANACAALAATEAP